MLKIQMEKNNDITTVTLEGAIDAYSARQFKESFNQLIEQDNYKLIVDLSRVDYMTAVGAGICMAIHNVAKENKGGLVLVQPKSEVKKIFGLIGLDQMMTIADSQDGAVSSFR